MPDSSRRLLALWRRLSRLPAGALLFSLALRRIVPYSGSTRPRILLLEPGHARLSMSDRAPVRNHLDSIHAIAIANIAELASGLAMTTVLPQDVRGIVVRLTVEYVKKARGTLVAEASCELPAIAGDAEHDFTATVTDANGDIVAKATATWRLGRVTRSAGA